MRSLSFETLLGASAQVRGHDHRDAARARRVRPRAKHAVRRPLGRKQGDGRPVSRDVGGDTGRYRETQGDTAALSLEMCGEMWGDTGRYGRPTRGRRHACPRRLRPCRRHPRSRRPRRLVARGLEDEHRALPDAGRPAGEEGHCPCAVGDSLTDSRADRRSAPSGDAGPPAVGASAQRLGPSPDPRGVRHLRLRRRPPDLLAVRLNGVRRHLWRAERDHPRARC